MSTFKQLRAKAEAQGLSLTKVRGSYWVPCRCGCSGGLRAPTLDIVEYHLDNPPTDVEMIKPTGTLQ